MNPMQAAEAIYRVISSPPTRVFLAEVSQCLASVMMTCGRVLDHSVISLGVTVPSHGRIYQRLGSNRPTQCHLQPKMP